MRRLWSKITSYQPDKLEIAAIVITIAASIYWLNAPSSSAGGTKPAGFTPHLWPRVSLAVALISLAGARRSPSYPTEGAGRSDILERHLQRVHMNASAANSLNETKKETSSHGRSSDDGRRSSTICCQAMRPSQPVSS
jgi:hypothetical protein